VGAAAAAAFYTAHRHTTDAPSTSIQQKQPSQPPHKRKDGPPMTDDKRQRLSPLLRPIGIIITTNKPNKQTTNADRRTDKQTQTDKDAIFSVFPHGYATTYTY
jgi:hypothetical protein